MAGSYPIPRIDDLEWESDHSLKDYQSFIPDTDNVYDIGTPLLRYNQIYAERFEGRALEAEYADIAEMYNTGESLPPGTLVEIHDMGEMRPAQLDTAHMAIGVVSTQPAFLLNRSADPETHSKVALLGRVPCLVDGPIKKGDWLMASENPGVAIPVSYETIKELPHLMLCTVGRSLETCSNPDTRMVEIIIGK